MLRITADCFVATESARTGVERAFQDRRLSKVVPDILDGGLETALRRYADRPSPPLIVLEESLTDGLFQRIESLAELCTPETNLILLGPANDIELYRELRRRGVADYLPVPFSPDRLAESVLDLYAPAAKTRKGQVIAFFGAKGGSGSSIIAHNAAYSLTRQSDGEALVVDLDLPFGCADLSFNHEASAGIRNALAEPERIDDVFLQRFAVKYDDRLQLLGAAASLGATAHVDPERLEAVIEALRQHAHHIVLDLPKSWSAWTQRALRLADTVVLTTPLDLAAVRNMRNLIDWLVQERPDDPAPITVVNNATPRGSLIEVKDFTSRLSIADPIVVPHDLDTFRLAMSAGKMLEEVRPRSKSAQAIQKLAERLAARSRTEAPAPAARRGGALSALATRLKTLRRR